MGDIDKAIVAIDALDPAEKIPWSKISEEHGVARSTLTRRYKGISTTRERKAVNQQALHPQQATELLRYIEALTRRGLPPTRAMIRNSGSRIAGRQLGQNWTDRFVKKHHIKLISKYAPGIDRTRFSADKWYKYKAYLDLIGSKFQEYDIQPDCMYNMDEKGIMLGVIARSKGVFNKQLYQEGKIRQVLQDVNREWTTILACICVDGQALRPSLIYQSDSGNIQDTWLESLDVSDDIAVAASQSGWTNIDIGLAWLKEVFDCNTKAKARRAW
jgi:hypothetical protein